jgi:hypothetical protein
LEPNPVPADEQIIEDGSGRGGSVKIESLEGTKMKDMSTYQNISLEASFSAGSKLISVNKSSKSSFCRILF